MARGQLTGIQKAAILLLSIGPEASATILKRHFSEKEVELISSVISDIGQVSSTLQSQVFEEFIELQSSRDYIMHGGIQYAQEMLERIYDQKKSMEILRRLTVVDSKTPFGTLKKTNPKHLLSFIKDENHQTIALVLSYLAPDQSSAILGSLDPARQSEIARRIATMERVSPEIIKEVEQVLNKKLSTVTEHDHTEVGGIQALVDILNRVDRPTEKTILEGLDDIDPMLAEEIKKRMFVFEDIVSLPDSSIQRVLREVDPKDLPLAMKGSNEEVHSRIYKNLSKRAADMLREEIEIMGPVRLRDVESAQQRIVNIIRMLDAKGEIVIARGGDDALLV